MQPLLLTFTATTLQTSCFIWITAAISCCPASCQPISTLSLGGCFQAAYFTWLLNNVHWLLITFKLKNKQNKNLYDFVIIWSGHGLPLCFFTYCSPFPSLLSLQCTSFDSSNIPLLSLGFHKGSSSFLTSLYPLLLGLANSCLSRASLNH